MVMDDLKGSSGIPSDELLDASPMSTYEIMRSGKGKGFCENSALVYYLFANAASIPTRLVDMAGKFGPLKLTGHYVCESWLQDHGRWSYVDPQSGVASVHNSDNAVLHTLEIKKVVDMGLLGTCRVFQHDPGTGRVDDRDASDFAARINGYLMGDVVLAYKFGYVRNLTFRRLRNFLKHPVLLYATFRLPNLYRLKIALAVLLSICWSFALVSGLWSMVNLP